MSRVHRGLLATVAKSFTVESMTLLPNQTKGEVPIAGQALKAAVENYLNPETFIVLLDEKGQVVVPITPDILNAALKNIKFGTNMVRALQVRDKIYESDASMAKAYRVSQSECEWFRQPGQSYF